MSRRMATLLLPLLALLLARGGESESLRWVVEPGGGRSGALVFSNSSGARAHCAASRRARLQWEDAAGAPLHQLPGLREWFENGTLWLAPFAAAQWRRDVHATVARCRARAGRDAIVSRDLRIEADEEWSVSAWSAPALAGGAALVRCALPASARAHLSVRWLRDQQPLPSTPTDPESGDVWGGARGEELAVRGARRGRAYSCLATHALTGATRLSAPHTLTLTEPAGEMAPRMISEEEELTVDEGEDVRLVCVAVGSPPPTYSWWRWEGGRQEAVESGVRVSVWGGVLALRRVAAADAGRWGCRAAGARSAAALTHRLIVRSPLQVSVHPPLQVVDAGGVAWLNCSTSADARVQWLRQGAAVAGAGGAARALRLVTSRSSAGLYQCRASLGDQSAQATAELSLGESAPELQYTFIEQALHGGGAVALRCAAAGAPRPQFTWLLDATPLDATQMHPRRTITQFVDTNEEVVSFLNISAVRTEDGGRYTCRATNARGSVQHSTRLNVYGPPAVRSVAPVRVVAGVNTTVHCPYYGFPISEIQWWRSGAAVRGAQGALRLWPAEAADGGVYECRVAGPAGRVARGDLQVLVRNPPKISGFVFPTDLVEGSSVQALCGITSGDKPVFFSWLKDGRHIPSSLQVQEKSLDEFSFLIFSHVTSSHSGDYTCVASNAAAEVNHTARLAVKVAPIWVYEPQDVSALLGTQILLHCATSGYPEPRITWFKGHGTRPEDFRPVSDLDLQFSLLSNGSLSITPAADRHAGLYTCRAENGIGRGLAKTVTVTVHEPAHFESPSRNVSVRRGAPAALSCVARGDAPLTLQWARLSQPSALDSYRASISEKRTETGVTSLMSIAQAERSDSGVYRCRAENAYGRDELLVYLTVQEMPETPSRLRVRTVGSRGAALAWRRGHDGNARLRSFRLQQRVLGSSSRPPSDWALAPARDIPIDRLQSSADSDPNSEYDIEYYLEGLLPATTYEMRISAVNDIGDSEYSDPIIINTLEEAPTEAPLDVQVQATAPGELTVTWRGAAGSAHAVWVTTTGAGGAGAEGVAGAARLLTAATPGAVIGGLRPLAHYEVRVRAYNKVGAGPPSAPVTVTTLEGPPEAAPQRVRCEPLSSQSLRVSWEPPPAAARGGVLLGYELVYEDVEDLEGETEWRRVGGLEAAVTALRRGANYSLQLRARTAAGAGPPAPVIHCSTHHDVPGPPANIKALAHSEESVIVSWLAPLRKNGRIKHYTVYTRPQRSGQQTQLVVENKADERELQAEVRGLIEEHFYEFWVTAGGGAGEGDASAVLLRSPSARAPAKVTSFGGVMLGVLGRRLRLRCGAAGPAARGEWARRRPSLALHADPRVLLEGPYLTIPVLDESMADNYTCTVRNPWGEDRVEWEVRALGLPAAPHAHASAAAPARLRVAWAPPPPQRPHLRGYVVEYRRDGEPAAGWRGERLPAEARAHWLERLPCGAPHRVRVAAYNAVGISPYSEELLISTKGGISKPPDEKDLIWSNSSCVRLNLLTWDSNGCPLSRFEVSVRALGGAWSARGVEAGGAARTLLQCGLAAARWHQLRLRAVGDAGTSVASYYFATLTEKGERIPAPAHFPEDGGGAAGAAQALIAAAVALFAALLLLVWLAWHRRSSPWCGANEYATGTSSPEPEKAVEKRDRRDCQQVYTSSPIKHSDKKDQQELYEISPYATFSMAGAGAGPGGTMRTFGRPEGAALGGPPSARGTPHRSHSLSDEYTLSRGLSRAVARDSDSESSGSPCAECASYRLPLASGKEEPGRAVTDSSAESEARARPERRRRARRHAPHPGNRYPQRPEQERRDFTIHV